MSEKLDALSARFDVKDVKQRTQGGRKLDYVSIDSTIRRFNEVLDTNWDTTDLTHSIIPLDGKYLAVVSLTVRALGKQAVGIGADVAPDPDKALKTALAEALKKAGHQFGVGLYLWDEEEREIVQKERDKQWKQVIPAGNTKTTLKTNTNSGPTTLGSGSL